MNSKYQKGRRTEYEAMTELEKEGYSCFRTAGSHSPFDVLAINKTEIRLLQAKSVKGKYFSFKKEIQEIKDFNNHPTNTIKELWIYLGRMKGREKQWKKVNI